VQPVEESGDRFPDLVAAGAVVLAKALQVSVDRVGTVGALIRTGTDGHAELANTHACGCRRLVCTALRCAARVSHCLWQSPGDQLNMLWSRPRVGGEARSRDRQR
jgi:hypothetical protein